MNEELIFASKAKFQGIYEAALINGMTRPVILAHQINNGDFQCVGLPRAIVVSKFKETGMMRQADYLEAREDEGAIDIVGSHLDGTVTLVQFIPTPENPSAN